MIRDLLKTIVNGPEPEPARQAKRSGEPCVVCGELTQTFCGMCVRAGVAGKMAICSAEESPACQIAHAKEKHRDGQVGETDPRWVG